MKILHTTFLFINCTWRAAFITDSPFSFNVTSISINLSSAPWLSVLCVLCSTLLIWCATVLKWKNTCFVWIWIGIRFWTIFCSTTLDDKNIVSIVFIFASEASTFIHSETQQYSNYFTLFESENEWQKIEQVPLPLPRASRNFHNVKTRNEKKNL